jgi:ABC-type microcin C transport system permease subunit YejE
LGSIQGYYGGYVDLIGQRLVEFWSGVPVLFLLILISSFIEIGFWTLLFVMSIFSWLGVVEFVRAETLKVKNCEYVFASKVLGANDWHIVVKHIIPNATISAFSILPFMFAGAIATLTSLDFLGFGLPSSYPSLGEIVEQAKNNFQCVWIVWTAFLSISILLLLVVFVGDGIKKAVTKTF